MRRTAWQTSTAGAAVFPELVHRRASIGSSGAGVEGPGHAVLEQAERQAQALMASAREKASAVLEEARREGALQGRAEGLADARQGLQALTNSLTAASERIRALEAECRARAEELIVTLALATAERVLCAEVAQNPSAILEPVKSALAALPSSGDVVIRVHPACAALLRAHREELMESGPGPAGLRVVADPSVTPGGCLVETPHSVVDATFPVQLEEARRRLLEASC
jgi:flagellar assembly protein FliH